jgi:hypothetical protein
VVAGATERWSLETVKEKENGQKPSFVQGEEKEKETCIVVSQRNVPEEHSDSTLIQWEKELEMLEEWLNHPKVEEYYQRDAVMKDNKGDLQEIKGPEEIKEKDEKPMGSNSRNLQQSDYQESERELQRKNLSKDEMDKEIWS